MSDQINLKGKTPLEAGYVWAPYIPLVVSPTLYGDVQYTYRTPPISSLIYKTEEQRIERQKTKEEINAMFVGEAIFDPKKFNPLKGVMTRNAKTTINPNFYGTIKGKWDGGGLSG